MASQSISITLSSVVVDCEEATIPGQIGVAVGRAGNVNHLQVKNFKPCLVKEHSPKVKTFYNHKSANLLFDGTCCKKEFISSDIATDIFLPFEISQHDSEFFSDSNSETDSIPGVQSTDVDTDNLQAECSTASAFPDYIEPLQILNECAEEYTDTPFQDLMEVFVRNITKSMSCFSDWLSHIFLKILKLYESVIPESELAQQKHLTQFVSSINTFLKSEEYVDCCKKLLSFYTATNSSAEQALLTSIAFKIQNLILKYKSSLVETPQITERSKPTETCEVGKGIVRYIGGYCVAKLKYEYKKQVQNCLHSFSKEELLAECRTKVHLLSQLTSTYNELLQSSEYKETLQITSRKQNLREGLINITDEAYLFFQTLGGETRKIESFETLYKYGEKTLSKISDDIL